MGYTGAEEAHTPFVVELIAEMRERLVQTYEGRYAAIAEDQKARVFVKETPDELTAPTCVVCHADAEQRCSKCQTEWYCSRKCQGSDWKRHKGICVAICESKNRADKEAPMIHECSRPSRPPRLSVPCP